MNLKFSNTFVAMGRLAVLTAIMLLSRAVSANEVEVFAEQAVARLSQYLQIDTINPPGNETRGVKFLSELLDEAGIEYHTAESAPGRGNLWAKLPATTQRKERGLVLLHHIDVVPANRDYWSFDPLSGEVKDGWIYGRGAIDTKGLGMIHLQAFLALHASGRRAIAMCGSSPLRMKRPEDSSAPAG